MARRIGWLAFVLGLGVGEACFEEGPPPPCPRGDIGCRCTSAGECEGGLVCSEDFCVIDGCTRGDKYCNCDEGTCVDGLECFEGSVCLDPTVDSGGVAEGDGSGDGDPDGGPSDGGATGPGGDSTGAPACALGEPCGPCQRCDATGSCVPDVGAPCDGPVVECDDFLWGYMGGACYRLAAATLQARCDAFGACSPVSPQDCPVRQGEPQVSCDASCVDGAAQCAAYAPAETVSVESMCIESGPGPDCTTACFNGSYSELNVRECSFGECVVVGEEECGAYTCENLQCNTSCSEQFDCAMFYVCEMGMCVLP